MPEAIVGKKDERAEFLNQIDMMVMRFQRIPHSSTCKNPRMTLRIVDQRRCGAVIAECMDCHIEVWDGPHFGNAGQTPFGMSIVHEYARGHGYPVIGRR